MHQAQLSTNIYFYLLASDADVADIKEMIAELKRAADWSADSYVIRTG